MRARATLRLARSRVAAGDRGGSPADPVPEIVRVAREHAPEGGYGETAFQSRSGRVFWVAADWTSNDELDAAEQAFLAIEGVKFFRSESESVAPVGDGWVHVWPEPSSEEAYERVLALAQRPLGLPKGDQSPPAA